MAGSIRERLAGAKTRVVEIDAAGIGPVRIRVLPCGEVLELVKMQDQRQAMLAFVAACLVDEQDKLVFAGPGEVAQLDWTTASVLNQAALAVNGLNPGGAEKNSGTARSCS